MSNLKMNDNVYNVLIAEKPIKQLIDKYGVIERTLYEDYFSSLVSSIVGQQLSNKVSDIIWDRVKNLVGEVTPAKLITTSDESLRACGISFQKIAYIKNLACAVINGEMNLTTFDELPDEDVIKCLTKVKGIGKWTAEMFLIFSLGREDVYSLGDGGLNNALHKLLKKEKLTKKEIEEYTNRFKPFRSYLSLYLWKSLDS